MISYTDTCPFRNSSVGCIRSAMKSCTTCKSKGYCNCSTCQCFICLITFRENSEDEKKIFKIAALTIHFKTLNKIIMSRHFRVNYNQLRDVQKNSIKIAEHNLLYKQIIDQTDEYYQKYLLLKLINQYLCQDVVDYIHILYFSNNIII